MSEWAQKIFEMFGGWLSKVKERTSSMRRDKVTNHRQLTLLRHSVLGPSGRFLEGLPEPHVWKQCSTAAWSFLGRREMSLGVSSSLEGNATSTGLCSPTLFLPQFCRVHLSPNHLTAQTPSSDAQGLSLLRFVTATHLLWLTQYPFSLRTYNVDIITGRSGH